MIRHTNRIIRTPREEKTLDWRHQGSKHLRRPSVHIGVTA